MNVEEIEMVADDTFDEVDGVRSLCKLEYGEVIVATMVCNAKSELRIENLKYGMKIRAKRIKNLRYVKTSIYKLPALAGCIPDPAVNHCDICRNVSALHSRSELIQHFHGFRQFGLTQFLSQYVNLSSVRCIIDCGSELGTFRISSSLNLLLFVSLLAVVLLPLR
jgi:hypothetical protein